MNAKDLLRAMSDIDPKYVREAQPWAAPVKKLTHPVWAAAAALVLCLGLGAGAALLLSPPQAQPIPATAGEQESALAFEQLAVGEEKIVPFAGPYGPAYAQASTAAENEETYRELSLTREQLEALWNGNDLPWDGIGLENVTLDATAAFQEEELIQVYIEAPDFFAIQLVSQTYAEGNAADWAQQVEESFAIANNLVEGTPVVAVSYDVTTLTDGKEVAQTDAQARFALGEAIVTVTASSSETAFPTQEAAEAFVQQVVNQCLAGGIDLNGIQAPQDDADATLEFVQWDEAEYETLFQEWANRYAGDVIQPQVVGENGIYRTQDLSLEQVKALWGGDFPWDSGHELLQNPRGYTYNAEDGNPVYAVVEMGGGDVGFTVSILTQAPQGEWGEALNAALEQANEEVNAVPVLTSFAQGPSTVSQHTPEGNSAETYTHTRFEALFQWEDTGCVIHAEAHVNDTQSDFSPQDAKDFVEQVVKGTLTGGIDLTPLQP